MIGLPAHACVAAVHPVFMPKAISAKTRAAKGATGFGTKVAQCVGETTSTSVIVKKKTMTSCPEPIESEPQRPPRPAAWALAFVITLLLWSGIIWVIWTLGWVKLVTLGLLLLGSGLIFKGLAEVDRRAK